MLVEEAEPRFPNEFSVCQETADAVCGTHLQEAFQERLSHDLGTAPSVREQGPHQGKGKAVPDSREQQDVDVLLSELPVCSIEDEVQLTWREKGEGKAGEKIVWELKLNEAEQTLIPDGRRAGQLDVVLQGVENDASSLDHGEHQGCEHREAAGIQRKGRPQGGLQAIVGGRLWCVFIAETRYRSRLSRSPHTF